jgi:hypothetical protein
VGKVMITVFCDCAGGILVATKLRWETVNSDDYAYMLTELIKCFKWVWPHKIPTKHCFSVTVQGCIQVWRIRKPLRNLFWTVLLHLPYSPNLASSDFHPFGALKDALCTVKFETDDSVICTVRSWLHEHDKAWYWQSIPTLVPPGHNTIEVDGHFVEKWVWSQTLTLHTV